MDVPQLVGLRKSLGVGAWKMSWCCAMKIEDAVPKSRGCENVLGKKTLQNLREMP
jgi:hypothetical protein